MYTIRLMCDLYTHNILYSYVHCSTPRSYTFPPSLLLSLFQTATLYPSIVFGVGFFLNFFIWGEHSSGAVPFTTMLALLCLWFGISFPLVFSGFYFGYRKQPYEHPVRTNQIPRQVPDQVWYLHPVLA